MMLEVPLSKSSVAKAQKALEAYADSLSERVDAGVGRAVEEGLLTAQMSAVGSLSAACSTERAGNVRRLRCDSDHAAFVEFGTGVTGIGTYGYQLPAGWAYDTIATPSAHDPNDMSKWFYYGDDGKRHWTYGMAARPFMAPAAARIRQVLPAAVKSEVAR